MADYHLLLSVVIWLCMAQVMGAGAATEERVFVTFGQPIQRTLGHALLFGFSTATKVRPSLHHRPTLFKQIRTMVGRLDLILNTVAECAFG